MYLGHSLPPGIGKWSTVEASAGASVTPPAGVSVATSASSPPAGAPEASSATWVLVFYFPESAYSYNIYSSWIARN